MSGGRIKLELQKGFITVFFLLKVNDLENETVS